MGVDMGSMRAALPSVGMVIVLLAQVSNMEVIKAAMSKGINKYVIIVYSDALSSLFFLFCSFLFHRSERPQLTLSILCSFFLLSVFGCSSQIFSFVGIQYSSPTLSTAMLNLIPAFTFVLAIIFRLEKLNWENKSSQAKSLGTFASIGGAFVVTFYKGPPLIGELSHSDSPRRLLLSPQLSWILGGFFLAAEAFMNSAWFILQALILRKFAAVLIIMFYLFFFNTILSTAFALIVVSEPSDWKLGLDIGLVAVLYSAVIGTGFRVGLCTWCLSRTGPLYVSMFKPLAIVFSIVMDVVIVGDAFCLGSLIGAMIIVAGFYAVMWGKSKEEKTTEDCGLGSVNSSREKVPLLQNRIEEN
ncbi:WAT1-related protein [Citrus sinensis]|uniref:WAT1-related protein At3g28050-like isoform X1 n=1 Tax=Citrus sinensis TaxID=2711 RepID=UPI0007635A0A|nr:WAT1-related protein At3g28050-like isoform X1 [Citrus sinensis]KAH9709089.1 WAT1-related protein [Citrus sinensis]